MMKTLFKNKLSAKGALTMALAICALGATAQNVTIPDANFKNYLLANTAINTVADGEISFAEAAAFNGTIYVQSQNIADLTGIEAFTALTQLRCDQNQLTALDVSANTALTTLQCHSNLLTELDVSNNAALTALECSSNSISTLDVSANTALQTLIFLYTQVTSIDVSSNSALRTFNCKNTPLNVIDFSSNAALYDVVVEGSALSALDLSFCPTMAFVNCSNTSNLTSLNIANGNNVNIFDMNASGNPNLACIKVDDVSNAVNNFMWQVENTNVYSLDCGPFVNIPDATFKSLLVGNGSINTVADAEISFTEAAAFSGAIDVYNSGITDMTGIEAFAALTSLDCGTNQLTTLDVSANVAITILLCDNNQLTSLNVANGNNINFVLFSAQSNPNLSCIQVDDASYSSASWLPENGFSFDAGIGFSEDCSLFVGLTEASNPVALSVYPNPATDLLSIRVGNATAISYNVLDLSGRSILNGNLSQLSTIDISSLSAGSYLIQVTTEQGNAMQQFMKH